MSFESWRVRLPALVYCANNLRGFPYLLCTSVYSSVKCSDNNRIVLRINGAQDMGGAQDSVRQVASSAECCPVVNCCGSYQAVILQQTSRCWRFGRGSNRRGRGCKVALQAVGAESRATLSP